MEPIKLVCKGTYGSATELYVIVDRLREFTSLIEHLNPETNTIELDFHERDVRRVLKIPSEREFNNSRPRFYRDESDHCEFYRFNCKYNGKCLNQNEEELIEESEWNPNCITTEIFNTAYEYNRPAIVRRVNDMLRSGTLCEEYAANSYNETNLDGIDADLKLDMLMFEHAIRDGSWVFHTIKRIRNSGCTVSLRHIERVNELLLEAHHDKKMEFYEDEVHKFVKFVTDQGFVSKAKIDKEQCTCEYGYCIYCECCGPYYKIYVRSD